MIKLIEATAGLAALGSPILLLLALVVIVESRNGQPRFVIVGGRIRRRGSLYRKGKYENV